jgi:hypothetical protein
MFGLVSESLQKPIAENAAGPGQQLRLLLEAGLLVSARGGGEVVWPVTVPEANGQPDVSAIANVMNRSLLMSQLLTLTLSGPMVHVRAPYADLTDRQIADLVLDMDLPIWTCWWMAASEHASGPLRERAILERTWWVRILKEAGWSGSLEARAVVRPVGGRQSGTAKGLGDKT